MLICFSDFQTFIFAYTYQVGENDLPIFTWNVRCTKLVFSDHTKQKEALNIANLFRHKAGIGSKEATRNGILLPKKFRFTVRKIVLEIEKNFWNSRLKNKNLEKFWGKIWWLKFLQIFLVLVPFCPAGRDGTGCQNPGPSRPVARFWACPVVPLSWYNEESFVPLSRKVVLSRPVGNPSCKQ